MVFDSKQYPSDSDTLGLKMHPGVVEEPQFNLEAIFDGYQLTHPLIEIHFEIVETFGNMEPNTFLENEEAEGGLEKEEANDVIKYDDG